MAAPDSAASELGRLLEGLGVPAEVCEGYSAATGIRSLHAWQRSCLNETRALDGGSAVVCVDTAGGKSLIAEAAAMVRLFASDEAHVLYVLPYVAMVSEKAAALTSALAPYNAASPRSERCSVHDCGETADWVDIKLDARKALTLCTPEAACGLLDRHALELLDRCESRRPAKRLAPSGHAALGSLALVIVDELHMVGDAGRGPTFEKLVTKLRALDAAKIRALDAESARQAASDAAAGEANDAAAESGAAAANDAAAGEAESDVSAAVPRDGAAAAPRGVQMIGLSATLANANVLARWLGATLHVASHRPVPLERRLKECKDDAAVFREVQGVVKKSVEAGEHVLVFYAYPSQASEAAKRLATVLRVGAGPAGAPAAAKAAAATKAAARRRAAAAQLKAESKSGAAPAALVELLANADNVHGVAYHSGELTPASRRVVEGAYREGALKVICCTSTLAAGVNLPCATVVIVALVDSSKRTFPLDLVQYEQIAGRAGRGGSKGAAKGKVHIIARVPDLKRRPELLKSIADALPSAKGGKLKLAAVRSKFVGAPGVPADRFSRRGGDVVDVARLLLEHVVALEAGNRVDFETRQAAVKTSAANAARQAKPPKRDRKRSLGDDDNASQASPMADVLGSDMAKCLQNTLRYAECESADDRGVVDEAGDDAVKYLVETGCLKLLASPVPEGDSAAAASQAYSATKLGRAVVAAGGAVAPLEARLLLGELERAKLGHMGGVFEDLEIAVCAAPLPGCDYHVAAALFTGNAAKACWRGLRRLLTQCGPSARAYVGRLVGGADRFSADLDKWILSGLVEKVLTDREIVGLMEQKQWEGSKAERVFRARRLWLALLIDAMAAPQHRRRVVRNAPVAADKLAVLLCGDASAREVQTLAQALAKLSSRGAASARCVQRFAARLKWDDLAQALQIYVDLVAKAQQTANGKPSRWPRPLRALRKMCVDDACLAATLQSADLRSVLAVAECSAEDLERILRDAAPWQFTPLVGDETGATAADSSAGDSGRHVPNEFPERQRDTKIFPIDSAFAPLPTLCLLLQAKAMSFKQIADADASVAKAVAKRLKEAAVMMAGCKKDLSADARRAARQRPKNEGDSYASSDSSDTSSDSSSEDDASEEEAPSGFQINSTQPPFRKRPRSAGGETYSARRSFGLGHDCSPRDGEEFEALPADYKKRADVETVFETASKCSIIGLACVLRRPPTRTAKLWRSKAWQRLTVRLAPRAPFYRGEDAPPDEDNKSDDEPTWHADLWSKERRTAVNAKHGRTVLELKAKSSRILYGCVLHLDGSRGDHPINLAPEPPVWPWEATASAHTAGDERRDDERRSSERRRSSGDRRSFHDNAGATPATLRKTVACFAALPCSALARCVGFLLFGDTYQHHVTNVVSKKWYVASRRAREIERPVVGAPRRLAELFEKSNVTLVAYDICIVAAILRGAGAPLGGIIVNDPRVAQSLYDQSVDPGFLKEKFLESQSIENSFPTAPDGAESLKLLPTKRQRSAASGARAAVVAMASLRRKFASDPVGRAESLFDGVEMRLVESLSEIMHSGVEIDIVGLRRQVADLKLILTDLRAVALDVLGISNLDAHQKVNNVLLLKVAKTCGAETKQQLEAIISADDGLGKDADGKKRRAQSAKLVLDYRALAPLLCRLKNLQRLAAPHPSICGRAADGRGLASCVRPIVESAMTRSGRLKFASPNLQSVERGFKACRRLERASLWDEAIAGYTVRPAGDRVLALQATVKPDMPLGSVTYGVVHKIDERSIGQGIRGMTPGATVAGYWEDSDARGFRWRDYTPEELRTIKQVAIRINGREYGWPADRVYRVEAAPHWPPAPAKDAGAVFETERVTPFSHECFVSPRSLFRARRGTAFIAADYAQNELRIAAELSKDSILTQALKANDPFQEMHNRRPEFGSRQLVKTIVYGLVYGQSLRAIAHKMGVAPDVATIAVDGFRSIFPKLDQFRRNVVKRVRDVGYVETLRGKRRWLPDINSTDAKKRSKAERQALSALVQGTAADQVKAAMIAAHEAFGALPRGERPRLVLQLHDELIFEVPLNGQKLSETNPSIVRAAEMIRSAMLGTKMLRAVSTKVNLQLGADWSNLAKFGEPTQTETDPLFTDPATTTEPRQTEPAHTTEPPEPPEPLQTTEPPQTPELPQPTEPPTDSPPATEPPPPATDAP